MVIEPDGTKGADGQDCTDAVLAELAERLRRLVRDGDDLARFGRGQIGVLMPDCEGQDLLSAGRRIRSLLESDALELEHGPDELHLVIGASFVPPHAHRTDFGELLAGASAALERAHSSEDRLSL